MGKFFLLVLMLISLLSCQKQAQKPQNQQPQERRVVVSLYRVKAEDVPLEYTTKGYFEGEKDIILRPLVSGRVLSLFVEEGDFVRGGQALLKIDPAEYENLVRQMEAQLAQARASYENLKAIAERRRLLFERELIAREEFENVQTQLRAQEEVINSLQAQVGNARLNLQRTTLTAPFSGYIAQRFINTGDYITPQSQTFRLVTLDPIRFVFHVPQEYVIHVRAGSRVKISVEPFGEREGAVFFVSPTTDNNRLITIKARLKNPGGELKPGMYGEARLLLGVEKGFAVPEQAVVVQGNRKVVWRILDGIAQPVQVEVIKQGQGMVYVKGELKEGEGIALENAYVLQQGVKVEVR